MCITAFVVYISEFVRTCVLQFPFLENTFYYIDSREIRRKRQTFESTERIFLNDPRRTLQREIT